MRAWESLSLPRQIIENVRAFVDTRHRMHVSPDWIQVRIEATLAARTRRRTRAARRRERMVSYDLKVASAKYRQWKRERRKVRPLDNDFAAFPRVASGRT